MEANFCVEALQDPKSPSLVLGRGRPEVYRPGEPVHQLRVQADTLGPPDTWAGLASRGAVAKLRGVDKSCCYPVGRCVRVGRPLYDRAFST